MRKRVSGIADSGSKRRQARRIASLRLPNLEIVRLNLPSIHSGSVICQYSHILQVVNPFVLHQMSSVGVSPRINAPSTIAVEGRSHRSNRRAASLKALRRETQLVRQTAWSVQTLEHP